jgi:hypothetical protein
MALHPNTLSMLSESLPEFIGIAQYSIYTNKPYEPGVYGYPATVLLFSIVDTIGSFYRGNTSFPISLDGKQIFIQKTSHHFYILNSKYYSLDLSKEFIDKIYDNFRSPLTHNAALPPGHYLSANPSPKSFTLHGGKPVVNLIPFLEVSKNAVIAFLTDISGKPRSKMVEELEKKKWQT